MHKFSKDLFQNAIDLNDTIVFEYDLDRDVIRFSENVDKYIPMPHNISPFVENLSVRGKIHSDDIKKAISFFSIPPEDGKVKMEYLRFLDFSGEFFWYQVKGRIRSKDSIGEEENVLYGTMTYIDDEKKQRRDWRSTSIDLECVLRIRSGKLFRERKVGILAGNPLGRLSE